MKILVIDIEANELLLKADRMHVLDVYEIGGTHHVWHHGEFGWGEFMADADILIGHNILKYDLPLLERLFGWKPSKKTALHDTMQLSQLLNYNRFHGAGHSLARWGDLLGFLKIDWRARAIELGLIPVNAPKGAEFHQYHEDMDIYCERDVDLTTLVYKTLQPELKAALAKNPLMRTRLEVERAVAQWNAKAELHGWPFNMNKARELEMELEHIVMDVTSKLEPLLGKKCVCPDGKSDEEEHTKVPKWTKDGCYHRHTADWFGLDPMDGLDHPELNDEPFHRYVRGPYCRVTFEPRELSSVMDVKDFLYKHGWQPTEFNMKKDPITGRKNVQGSPKITEDSLELLGGDGKLYATYAVAKSRLSNLRGFIEAAQGDGKVHGSVFDAGTPSFRARHALIANIPSENSKWGPEMRDLFMNIPGWMIVGCDSAGNQARGLAHYLGNEEYTHILLNEDIHMYNVEKGNAVLVEMGEEPQITRPKAKRILYAFLFGASGGKLWSYITGSVDGTKGNKFKNGFMAAVPGLDALMNKLKAFFGATKKQGPFKACIFGIAGERIFVDSMHKLLVYLLQALEKATCAAAVMLAMRGLEEADIEYIPLIFNHDEIQFLVKEERAEEARQIGIRAFQEGPKLFGVTIMDGDGKIGHSWSETH